MITNEVQFYQAMADETRRLSFLVERDGLVKASEFADRTLDSYHRSMSNQNSNARSRELRSSFLASIVVLEHFLGEAIY